MPPTPVAPRPWSARAALAAGLLGSAVASAPADVVILKDGFIIQGTVKKEHELFFDAASGRSFPLVKANGFDFIDEGPKMVIFSSHHKQLGQINKDIKLRPEYRAYRTSPIGQKGIPLPIMLGGRGAAPDFDARWRRKFQVHVPDGFENIEQQVTYLDPYTCYIVSTSHSWGLAFKTAEMNPQTVRKLLMDHPELAEPGGACDPLKRVALAQFFLDAGWLQLAQDEFARLKKDHPAALPKEAQDALDKVTKQYDQAAAELVVTEADQALNAGRYRYAGELLAAFPDKTADPREVERATRLMAQHKTATERFDTARRLLRMLIDGTTGGAAARAGIAGGGGPAGAVWPVPKTALPLAALAAGAETVYAEIHPDSVGRLEFFVNLADQVERERAAGKEPSKKPEELLATAVSGWARGKNAATPNPEPALRIWEARQMVLGFQRGADRNARSAVLAKYRQAPGAIGLDELVQVISLLPPAEPEDLAARTGELTRESNGAPPDTYKRRTPGTVEHPGGLEYLVKLPPEYHHGRAYPVQIALTSPSMDPEVMLLALSREADKNGYILVAPLWTNQFAKGWEWKGEEHDNVTGVLRDVVRHFTVDNDRVFLFGASDGANMAFDIGLSHPDLFAGVVLMSPTNPRWAGTGMQYWQNAQKLPFYVVTGSLAGRPNTDLRLTFNQWMPKGFAGIHALYKGRGTEWFPGETPVLFDWMNRKKRVNGAATLQLGADAIRYEWQIMRPGDNRFYWLGADKIAPGNLMDGKPLANVVPAGLNGDIKGNQISLRTRGVRTVTVWLSRDMIDWSKPVSVQLDGQAAWNWKAHVLEPDVQLLLDDYLERGDRRMLFLAKLEFQGRN